MKKLFLSMALVAGSVVASFANTINILNATNCAYFVYLYEGEGYLYVTPGYNNFYADPSQVPNSTAPATGTFYSASIRRDDFPDGFNVGTAPLNPPYRSSSDVNDYPACNGGLAYDVYWNTSNGNVFLLIM